VLQPPEIRHRVLECGADTEVIELASPAAHETVVDHDLALPTATVNRARTYGGQRFVRHEAANASWSAWHADGLEARDLGIAAATDGLADARVVRARAEGSSARFAPDAATRFFFVLRGAMTIDGDDRREALAEGGAFVAPPGMACALGERSDDFEALYVALGASR
jgi:hypothetical protein